MRKFRLLLAFMLVVLISSSCDSDKFPDPQKNKVIVEVIEQNYIALRPSYLSQSSYSNPKNIFLEEKDNKQDAYVYNWYKKVNGVYQIFSLNFESTRKLETNLVYEIIDTLHVSQEAYKINNEYLDATSKPLAMACQNGSALVKKIKHKEVLSQYFWLKTKFLTRDSLLNYDPKTKSFFTSKTKVVSEIKTDLGPIILVLLFLLFTTAIAFRDKINWLKNIREKIFDSFFSDHFGINKNDHQLNSFILCLLIIVFNSVYFLIWNNTDGLLTIFFSIILGFIVRFAYWPDKLIPRTSNYDFNKLSSIVIITGVLALELILIEAPKDFGAIGLSLVFLPALINLIIELIKYKKWKKWLATQPDVDIIG